MGQPYFYLEWDHARILGGGTPQIVLCPEKFVLYIITNIRP